MSIGHRVILGEWLTTHEISGMINESSRRTTDFRRRDTRGGNPTSNTGSVGSHVGVEPSDIPEEPAVLSRWLSSFFGTGFLQGGTPSGHVHFCEETQSAP